MLPWLGLALIVLIADQFTKVLILGYYKLGDSTYVTSFFNIVRAHNTGAAFSFLAAASGWQRWLFTGHRRGGHAVHPLPAAQPRRTRSCSASRWPASWAAPSAT
jgi:hypothetical protein